MAHNQTAGSPNAKTPSATSPIREGLFQMPDGRNLVFTFLLLCTLFFLWAVCNGMIDVMDKHFQNELNLTKSQSANVQFAHYLGYFLMALPAGWLARKAGWKGGIIAGLLLVAVGGFWFLPATAIQNASNAGRVSATTAFGAYLFGVCVIAAGLTFLETVANPYATVLGPARFAATRINLAQVCNGIGWIFGPKIGALFFYSKDPKIYVPYVSVAIIVLVLAVVFKFSYVPEIKNEELLPADESTVDKSTSLMARPHFLMGVAAQFFYVAAQAGIFGFFINCLTVDKSTGFSMVPHIPDSWNGSFIKSLLEIRTDGTRHISDAGAATLASFAFFAFLAGRGTGTLLMRKFAAHRVLTAFGVLNIVACGLVFCNLGWISVANVFLTYFFMSIMFPTIFALGIFGLGAKTKKASAFIIMAIMGGAILPKLMGSIADHFDIAKSFAVPLLCFVFVTAYAVLWPRLSKANLAAPIKITGGH